jgi:hypothetical protein
VAALFSGTGSPTLRSGTMEAVLASDPDADGATVTAIE